MSINATLSYDINYGCFNPIKPRVSETVGSLGGLIRWYDVASLNKKLDITSLRNHDRYILRLSNDTRYTKINQR